MATAKEQAPSRSPKGRTRLNDFDQSGRGAQMKTAIALQRTHPARGFLLEQWRSRLVPLPAPRPSFLNGIGLAVEEAPRSTAGAFSLPETDSRDSGHDFLSC